MYVDNVCANTRSSVFLSFSSQSPFCFAFLLGIQVDRKCNKTMFRVPLTTTIYQSIFRRLLGRNAPGLQSSVIQMEENRLFLSRWSWACASLLRKWFRKKITANGPKSGRKSRICFSFRPRTKCFASIPDSVFSDSSATTNASYAACRHDHMPHGNNVEIQ